MPFLMLPYLTFHQIQTPVLASLHTACIRRNKTNITQPSSSKSSHSRVHNQSVAVS